MSKYSPKIGLVELPFDLYAYLRDTSFERALKLPDGHPEKVEFYSRLKQLELTYRNTNWE